MRATHATPSHKENFHSDHQSVSGAHALMIEMHPNPRVALSDVSKALTPVQFESLMIELKALAAFVGVKM